MTALAVALAYCLGSVPTGLWLGLRLRGVDIRQHGSKNIGATNTLRVLGKTLGLIALAADVAKGALGVYIGHLLSGWDYAPLACGIAAIAGHTLSMFLKFHGGKGVATGAGVFIVLCPIPTAIAVGVFGVLVAATRMVSAASIGAAIALATATFFFNEDLPLRTVVVLIAAFVVFKHRTNIARILRGKESRLGRRTPGASEASDRE